MKLVSVNAGLPRDVEWQGKIVRTSIFKSPVDGRVPVRTINLDGDRQSDLTVHGGPDKAVYAYPSEHYAFWRADLPGVEFLWGAFGENFTTEGLLEDQVCVGDRLRCGSAEFIVTQPRIPCFKLGLRFGRLDMTKRFQQAGRSGFYLAVLREGEVGAGDAIETTPAEGDRLSIRDLVRLYVSKAPDAGLLRRASELPAFPEGWRTHFRERLQSAG